MHTSHIYTVYCMHIKNVVFFPVNERLKYAEVLAAGLREITEHVNWVMLIAGLIKRLAC